jgi:hypothetical protein
MRKRKLRLGVFRALLRFYPCEFRDEYGREMTLLPSDRYQAAANARERTLIALQALTGVLTHAPIEHCSVLIRDLTHACRLLCRSPAFAVTRFYR